LARDFLVITAKSSPGGVLTNVADAQWAKKRCLGYASGLRTKLNYDPGGNAAAG
jgi:hypothetical protein